MNAFFLYSVLRECRSARDSVICLYVQFCAESARRVVIVKRMRGCCRWVPLMRSGHDVSDVSFRARPVNGRD